MLGNVDGGRGDFGGAVDAGLDEVGVCLDLVLAWARDGRAVECSGRIPGGLVPVQLVADKRAYTPSQADLFWRGLLVGRRGGCGQGGGLRCVLLLGLGGHVAGDGPRGSEDIGDMVVGAEGVGEEGALAGVAGRGEGLGGLAGGAGALVLLFNGEMVLDGAGVAALQVVGEGGFVEGDGHG